MLQQQQKADVLQQVLRVSARVTQVKACGSSSSSSKPYTLHVNGVRRLIDTVLLSVDAQVLAALREETAGIHGSQMQVGPTWHECVCLCV